MSSTLLSFTLLLASTAYTSPLDTVARDACNPCSPSGATGTNPPAVGSDMSSMYVDLVSSVKGINFEKRWGDDAVLDKRAGSICCAQGTSCVNLQGLNIPMCYDKFTTNYILADGSYGSITTGDYNAKDGSKANLLTGKYTKAGGDSGDIYANNAAAKPNTATLSVPPQWTGSGVGSAIPVTALASVVLITTTIPGTTITTPTVVPASTIYNTVSGQTVAVSTVPEKTITAPTTLAPITSVMTSVQSAAAASSTHSKGAAGRVAEDSSVSLGFSMFTALMYAIYAL